MTTIFSTESLNLATEDSTRYHQLKPVRKVQRLLTPLQILSNHLSSTLRLWTIVEPMLARKIVLQTTMTGAGHDRSPLHLSRIRIYPVPLDTHPCLRRLRTPVTRLRKVLQGFSSMNGQTDLSRTVLTHTPAIFLGVQHPGEALMQSTVYLQRTRVSDEMDLCGLLNNRCNYFRNNWVDMTAPRVHRETVLLLTVLSAGLVIGMVCLLPR